MESQRSPDERDRRASRDLELAAQRRLEADRRLSMSERLAVLHELCRQVAAIEGASERR